MSRYKERYFAPEGWDFKHNFLLGTEWTVDGSKAGSSYTVTLTPKGFTCECQGFMFHGKCKHTTQVVERFDELDNEQYRKQLEDRRADMDSIIDQLDLADLDKETV